MTEHESIRRGGIRIVGSTETFDAVIPHEPVAGTKALAIDTGEYMEYTPGTPGEWRPTEPPHDESGPRDSALRG